MQRTSLVLTSVVFSILGTASSASAKDLIEYFKPVPIVSPLTHATWGAANVLPRDIKNGLEDSAALPKYCYWDGKILRAKDGKYHLFGSRWDESQGHSGWSNSVAVHAVSDRVDGPYLPTGLLWPNNQNGKGHNVTATELADGRYAVVVSETRPGDIFTSSSLDGPWTYEGSMKFDTNGVAGVTQLPSNVSLIVRPDNGRFMAVSRHGFIMISTSLLGPYVLQGPSVYPKITGLNNGNAEDPVLWYSGGMYHITVNWWNAKLAYHLASVDGIHNWKNMGLAYTPMRDYIKYTDGTANRWTKIERPGVVIEGGHVTHFTFAVIDVEKEQELGHDNHSSKVIVVPFDGLQFDIDNGACGTACTSAGGEGGSGGTGGAGSGSGASGAGGAGGAGGSPESGTGNAGASTNPSDTGGSAGTNPASSDGGLANAGLSSSAGAGGANPSDPAPAAGTAGMLSTAGANAAGSPNPTPGASGDNGCNCALAGRAPSRRLAWLSALFGVLSLVRRRRRQ